MPAVTAEQYRSLADLRRALARPGATVHVIGGTLADGRPHHAIGQTRTVARVTGHGVTWATGLPAAWNHHTLWLGARYWYFPAPGIAAFHAAGDPAPRMVWRIEQAAQ